LFLADVVVLIILIFHLSFLPLWKSVFLGFQGICVRRGGSVLLRHCCWCGTTGEWSVWDVRVSASLKP